MKLGPIVLGTYTGDTSTELVPIMAHPPIMSSDLLLESFLNTIIDVSTIFFANFSPSSIAEGPFKYCVSKEVGGWGGQLLTSADKVGGWGWPNTDVSKKKEKNFIQQKSFLF